MTEIRKAALASISTILCDYRVGRVQRRSPELVDAWVAQFPIQIQDEPLDALSFSLASSYVSKEIFIAFLKGLAASQKVTGTSDPKVYWKSANFLQIQKGGSSQQDICGMFDGVLKELYGFGISETGSATGDFIYLDDGIATGSRLRADVCSWLEGNAPKNSKLQVIAAFIYSGSYWVESKIQETATKQEKKISVKKWSVEKLLLENRLAYRNEADILWPTIIPDVPAVEEYVQQLENNNYPPILRAAGNAGKAGIFRNDSQKQIIEQAFLIRGCQIKLEQKNLPVKARPLGYQNLDSVGFGSMLMTFRNCPNNCPLALWVEQPRFPALLPRKTNQDSAIENAFKGFGL